MAVLPLILGVTLSPYDIATLDHDCFVSSDVVLFLVELSLLRTPREVREKVFLVNPFAWIKWCGSKQESFCWTTWCNVKYDYGRSGRKNEAAKLRAGKAQYAVSICPVQKHFFLLAVSLDRLADVVVLDSNHDSVVFSRTHYNAVKSFYKLLNHVFPTVDTPFPKQIVIPKQYPQQLSLDCSMHCAMAIDTIFKQAATEHTIVFQKLPFRSPPAGWRSVVQGLLNGVKEENKGPTEEFLASIQKALFSSMHKIASK